MNEVVREFLLETHENLAQLDLDLVTLEKEPAERETLSRVFRTLHTVKGTAGFLGLPKLQAVAHAAENLLTRLRAGELAFNPEIATGLLAVVDAVRRMLAALEASEGEGPDDYTGLIQTVERLAKGGSAHAPAPKPPPALAAVGGPSIIIPQSGAAQPTRLPPPQTPESSPRAEPPRPPTPPRAQPVPPPPPPAVTAPPPAPPPAPAAPSPSRTETPARGAPPVLRAEMPTRIEAPPSPPSIKPEPSPREPEQRSSAVSDSSIRVDVGLLDKLMTLVGELVLARNQIMQFSASQEDAAFLGTVQRLNLLTTELQAGVMKTRMQPIGNVWSKFPRLVRDLALACGKQVRIEMEGQDTDLDKTIIEAIRDPLTHMVRNAIDHGIESPADRTARGKPAEGLLALHASHEGGKVIIELADDGCGIDPQRVREKALQAKVVTQAQLARMSDREIVNLVFLPGFSTADRVTQFSGRGVGMDVVRTNIEKIGGTVDLESRPGRGTTVKMKIPLTLAIIPALTITSGGDRYAIPQVNLLELVRLEGEQAAKGIELIHGAPVYRLRGNLLPLVYLNQQLQVEDGATPGEINIVILQADERQFGLVVDAIHDTEEIVVKPLQKQLKGINAFAGATIMGDGRVALILDVLGLAQRANVIAGVRERSLSEKAASAPAETGDRQTVLLFTTADGGRMAVPLALVARLEEFPRSAIERVGPQDVVQYRGEILPLIHVGRALKRKRPANGHGNGSQGKARIKQAAPAARDQVGGDGMVPVVVYAGDNNRRVGLVVGQILDIVEESLAARSRSSRPGVLFTAVIQERVTEFLDVEGIVRASDPAFITAPVAAGAEV